MKTSIIGIALFLLFILGCASSEYMRASLDVEQPNETVLASEASSKG